ncbi:MAG: hypothetical protein QOD00_2238, partial [Blastocatellia bacterium]|nr:hypothetical protein [Blastocatellia bacterium]
MPQQWNRSYPLHLLDAFLTGLVSPFTRAKRIEVYATHGYYLLGIVLFIATCLLWELGLLGVILSQLPPWLRDIPVSTFGPFWRKFLPESIPFIAVLGLLYWIL